MKNQVADYFQKEVKRSAEIIGRLKQAHSEEDIHKLRVSIRRLRTLMKAGDVHLKSSSTKHLKKIWKHLGKDRDLENSASFAKEFHIEQPKLFEELETAHEKTFKVVDKKKTEKLLKELEKKSHSKDINEKAIRKAIPDLIDTIKTFPLNEDYLHEFRILLKKVRYIVESLGHETGKLADYQDILGKRNDLKTFREKAGDTPRVRKAEDKQTNLALSILKPASNLATDLLLAALKPETPLQ